MLDCSLIVVNYRSRSLSEGLLRVLGPTRPRELVVVDNSPDEGLGASESLKAAGTTYVPMERNVGFAAACNVGIERTRGNRLVLLNPDTEPEPGCLPGLLRLLADPGVAATAPRLVPFDARRAPEPCALWRDPDVMTALVEYTAVRRLRRADWLSRHYFVDPALDSSDPFEVAAVQGACLALSRPWLERVGAFDARRFFLYWEETDLCRRLRGAGGRVLYSPFLRCRHAGGASSGPSNARSHFWRGFYAYHRKHGGPLVGLLLRPLLVTGTAAECAILAALSLKRRGNDPRLKADRQRLWGTLLEQI